MYPNDIDFAIKQEQYADLRREAEQERLIRAALAGQPARETWLDKLIQWLRNRLAPAPRRLRTARDKPASLTL